MAQGPAQEITPVVAKSITRCAGVYGLQPPLAELVHLNDDAEMVVVLRRTLPVLLHDLSQFRGKPGG